MSWFRWEVTIYLYEVPTEKVDLILEQKQGPFTWAISGISGCLNTEWDSW